MSENKADPVREALKFYADNCRDEGRRAREALAAPQPAAPNPISKPARQDCPSFHDHTPCPEGYIQWHAWAKRMSRTHQQDRCPSCKLWTIWVLKPSAVDGKETGDEADEGK